MKVIIDPGHGGMDSGACYFDLKEKDLNLDFSTSLGNELMRRGHEIIYTRTEDKTLLLADRTKNPGDIFISIHHNAATSAYVHGYEIWYSKNNVTAKKLCGYILNAIERTSTFKDYKNRGAKEGTALFVLKRNPAIPILFEVCFMSCKKDVEFVRDARREICTKICDGMETFWRISYGENGDGKN
jgi:N-acetylmuramoyl-L-alanine amidase